MHNNELQWPVLSWSSSAFGLASSLNTRILMPWGMNPFVRMPFVIQVWIYCTIFLVERIDLTQILPEAIAWHRFDQIVHVVCFAFSENVFLISCQYLLWMHNFIIAQPAAVLLYSIFLFFLFAVLRLFINN